MSDLGYMVRDSDGYWYWYDTLPNLLWPDFWSSSNLSYDEIGYLNTQFNSLDWDKSLLNVGYTYNV